MQQPIVNVNVDLSTAFNIQSHGSHPTQHVDELPPFMFDPNKAALMAGRNSYSEIANKLSWPDVVNTSSQSVRPTKNNPLKL